MAALASRSVCSEAALVAPRSIVKALAPFSAVVAVWAMALGAAAAGRCALAGDARPAHHDAAFEGERDPSSVGRDRRADLPRRWTRPAKWPGLSEPTLFPAPAEHRRGAVGGRLQRLQRRHAQSSMTPLQALQAATNRAAAMLGWSRTRRGLAQTGPLRRPSAGVEGDPRPTRPALERVALVVKGGVVVRGPSVTRDGAPSSSSQPQCHRPHRHHRTERRQRLHNGPRRYKRRLAANGPARERSRR